MKDPQSIRERLPNRRDSINFNFQCGTFNCVATISFFPDGRLAEIFLGNGKAGSTADSIAKDAALICSIALQHGVPLEVIRRALLRTLKAALQLCWAAPSTISRRHHRNDKHACGLRTLHQMGGDRLRHQAGRGSQSSTSPSRPSARSTAWYRSTTVCRRHPVPHEPIVLTPFPHHEGAHRGADRREQQQPGHKETAKCPHYSRRPMTAITMASHDR